LSAPGRAIRLVCFTSRQSDYDVWQVNISCGSVYLVPTVAICVKEVWLVCTWQIRFENASVM